MAEGVVDAVHALVAPPFATVGYHLGFGARGVRNDVLVYVGDGAEIASCAGWWTCPPVHEDFAQALRIAPIRLCPPRSNTKLPIPLLWRYSRVER